MIIPKPLQKGDTIGFFSPSSPATVFAPERFERAKAYVEAHGYQVKAGCLTGKTDQYRSGSIQERVEELNALIRDPEVRCIMSTIGGYNSNSLLPYIDYEALKQDPKIIVGYSDVTALLMGIYAQTGIVTFYGPAFVASLGEFPPLVDETFASFESIVNTLVGLEHQYTMPQVWTDEWIEWGEQDRAKHTLPNHWHFKGEGKITGRLIGGNLNTMTGIWQVSLCRVSNKAISCWWKIVCRALKRSNALLRCLSFLVCLIKSVRLFLASMKSSTIKAQDEHL